MNEWLSDLMSERVGEWMGERASERVGEWVGERVIGWAIELFILVPGFILCIITIVSNSFYAFVNFAVLPLVVLCHCLIIAAVHQTTAGASRRAALPGLLSHSPSAQNRFRCTERWWWRLGHGNGR